MQQTPPLSGDTKSVGRDVAETTEGPGDVRDRDHQHQPGLGGALVTITFNDILHKAGVDPVHVRLVRHQDNRRDCFELWKAGLLDAYQEIQHRPVFNGSRFVSSFVATPRGTVFVGLYSIDGVATIPAGTTDPISGDVSGMNRYSLTQLADLEEYVGRLYIDWGLSTRTWCQRAHKQDKPVTEIRNQEDDPFPGFDAFRINIEDFNRLPASWVEVLRTIKGVYLLVDRETGKQYVGSAKGTESIWGRWAQYSRDGHGGNREMRKLGHRPYQMTVLQAMPMVTLDEGVEAVESQWKQKLLTRIFGLNAN